MSAEKQGRVRLPVERMADRDRDVHVECECNFKLLSICQGKYCQRWKQQDLP